MSYKKQSIKVEELLVNPSNFRFDPVTSQKEAINIMVNKMKQKLKKLAEDIAQNGLNPTESLTVTKKKNKYIVHEGNRRLTALKLIINPKIVRLDEKTRNFFQKLKTDYGHKLPSEIECTIFSKKEDTYPWTQLKHTGENKGVGVVPWNNKQKGRFEAYIADSKPKKHIQVQDFMKKNLISFPDRHSTTLERLISNPDIRKKIGIDFKNGDLKYQNKQVAIDNLKRVSSAMNEPGFSVRKLDQVSDRKKWINKILTKPKIKKIIIKKDGKVIRKRIFSDRATLIPGDFSINIPQSKVQLIYHELKLLNVSEYRNAVAVLFRVFLELSVTYFIKNKKLSKKPNLKLYEKIKFVSDYMKANNILTEKQLRSVYTATRKESKHSIFSTQTFNDYVHNLDFIPLDKDLKITWENMQPFIQKLWE